MADLQSILGEIKEGALWVAAVAGVLGTLGILFKALRGSLIGRRATALRETATTEANAARESGGYSGAMSCIRPVPLRSWLDHAAARQLVAEGKAVIDVADVLIEVSFLDAATRLQLRGLIDERPPWTLG